MTIVIKVNVNSLLVTCSTKGYETVREFILKWADEQAYVKSEVLLSERSQQNVDEYLVGIGKDLKTDTINSPDFPRRSANEYVFYMRDLGYIPNQQADLLSYALRMQFPELNVIVN